jgi:hypothetical protein
MDYKNIGVAVLSASGIAISFDQFFATKEN